ncbi:MAG TPA: DUF4231 domain-containing protein [Dehalococcoidia bacterium]|nr:DUF4231 domain-containing protein [Dehalococcoidia bacterium]
MNADTRMSVPSSDLTSDPAVLPEYRRVGAYDDMTDTPEDLASWPALSEILALCRDTVTAAYLRADAKALRNQRRHRLITVFAIVFGTLAVLLAVVQLSHLIDATWPASLEALAAIIAAVSVTLGLVASQQINWLVERHKAERCRLLKYRFLIDPALWTGATARAERIATLRAELAEIEGLRRSGLHHWIEEDELPEVPDFRAGTLPDRATLTVLTDYYLRKRLDVQAKFFEDRARRNVRQDALTRRLPPALFFGSVLAALGHFSYDLATGDHGASTISVLLIVLAVVLAVIGAGVRTFRGAHEFARNTNRFRAKYIALSHLRDRLRHETDPASVCRDLWYSEQILESEHREWLRLMIDAEWFG